MLNLTLKAVSLTDPVGTWDKAIVDRKSYAGVVQRPAVEVAVSVGGFLVDLSDELAVWLPGYLPSFPDPL